MLTSMAAMRIPCTPHMPDTTVEVRSFVMICKAECAACSTMHKPGSGFLGAYVHATLPSYHIPYTPMHLNKHCGEAIATRFGGHNFSGSIRMRSCIELDELFLVNHHETLLSRAL